MDFLLLIITITAALYAFSLFFQGKKDNVDDKDGSGHIGIIQMDGSPNDRIHEDSRSIGIQPPAKEAFKVVLNSHVHDKVIKFTATPSQRVAAHSGNRLPHVPLDARFKF